MRRRQRRPWRRCGALMYVLGVLVHTVLGLGVLVHTVLGFMRIHTLDETVAAEFGKRILVRHMSSLLSLSHSLSLSLSPSVSLSVCLSPSVSQSLSLSVSLASRCIEEHIWVYMKTCLSGGIGTWGCSRSCVRQARALSLSSRARARTHT
jgi:hypothetical protein